MGNWKKRAGAMLLALCMLLTMLPVHVLAADNVTLTVNTADVGTLSPNDAFVVPVVIANNTGFTDFNLQVTYDAAAVTLTKVSLYPSQQAEDDEELASAGICATGLMEANAANGQIAFTKTNAITKSGTLFYLWFTVNEGAASGDYTISIEEYVTGMQNSGSPLNPTIVSGTITIQGAEPSEGGLTFKNGNTTVASFDDLTDDITTVAAPAAPVEGYIFLGWFNGLTATDEITVDANGYYVLTDSLFAGTEAYCVIPGTELRPKYDTPTIGGTYNALWLNDNAETTLSQESTNLLATTGTGETRYYSTRTTGDAARLGAICSTLDTAVAAVNDGGRIKLIEDLTLDCVFTDGYDRSGVLVLTTGFLTLDLNGYTLATTADFSVKSTSNQSLSLIYVGGGSLAVENSASAEGAIVQGKNDYWNQNKTVTVTGNGDLSLQDVTVSLECNNTSSLDCDNYCLDFSDGHVSAIRNCTLKAVNTGYRTSYVLYNGGYAGSIDTIENCRIETNGVLVTLTASGMSIGSITNTTMTSTATSGSAFQNNGSITFGAGNTVTTAQSVLFNRYSSSGCCSLTFTTTEGTYKTTAAGGAVFGGTYKATAPEGKTALDNGAGLLVFEEGFTVNFYYVDGATLYTSIGYHTGGTVTSPVTFTWGNNGLTYYTHIGWTTDVNDMRNGTPVELAEITENTNLYPVYTVAVGEAAVEMTRNGTTKQYLNWADMAAEYDNMYPTTIKLLADLEGEGMYLSGGADMTLDLNGHTLTLTGSEFYLVGYNRTGFDPASWYRPLSFTVTDTSGTGNGVLQGDATLTNGLIATDKTLNCVTIENVTLSAVGEGNAAIVLFCQDGGSWDSDGTNSLTITNATVKSAAGPAVLINNAEYRTSCKAAVDLQFIVNEGAVLEGKDYAVVISLVKNTSDEITGSVTFNGGKFKGALGAIQDTSTDIDVSVTYRAGMSLSADPDAEGYYTLVPIPLVVDNDTGVITGNAQSSVDENGTVTVDASAVGTGTVTLSADTVATLESGNSLTVTTGTATVAFNAGATADIAAQTGDVVLSVKDVTEGSTHTDAKAVYDLSLTSGGTAVTFTGSVDVTIPFTGEAGKGYVVYYYDAGGNKELVPASFGESSVTFTTTHFSEFGIEEQAGYTLEFRLPTGADKHFDAGETITAELWVSRAVESQIRSYQFTLTYDDTLLTLGGITLESAFNKQVTINGAAVAGNTTGEGVTVGADGVKLGTVTFTVNSDVTEGATDTLDAANVIFSHALDNQELAGDVAALDVTLHNLSVTLKAGTNSTINGGTDDVTLYAKYGQTGLYSDPARTVPVNSVSVAANIGYRLADNNWIDENSTEYADFNTIKGQTFTDTTAKTYTLQTVAQYIITIGEPVNAALTTGSNAPITVDAGTLLSAAALPTFTPNAGYAEDGWYVNDTKVDPATYAVNGNITVAYKAAAETFAFAVPDTAATGVTVTTTGGVTDGTVSYGTNVTGTISSDDTALITGVTVTIGGVETTAYAESNGDGTWTLTIPGTVITGNIEIEAATLAIHTVTFSNGAGVETLAQTAYVVDGRIGYYTTVAALKNGTVDFTVPVPVASAGYRLSVNLWKIGETEYTNSEIVNKTYTDDAAIVAQAVQQWTVTFAAGANGALADGAVTSITVDNGTTVDSLLQYLPATKPDAGYVFDQWTWNPTGTAITGNTTVTASFKDGSYPISFPTVSNVTVAATGGVTDGQATHGTDVTFTVVVGEGANVTKVSYSVNGTAVELTPDASGVYTIPGSAITGPVSVLIESNATYQITFAAGANGKVDGGASVTKTFDANHLLTDSDLPTVQPDAGYVFDQWVPNPVGMTVTGAATYTATFKDATYSVDNNGTTGTVTHGENYTFTPAVEGQIVTDVTVTIGGTVVTIDPNPDGSYTIPGDAITGNVVITYTSITAHFEFISYDQYAAGISGKQIAILVTDKVADGSYSLTGYNEAYYSVKYGGYVWFVNDTETEATLSAKLSAKTGAAIELTYEDGDLNGSGTVTAADAGIINDVLHQNSAADSVSLAYTIGDKLRFELDVMGDKSVTTKDIMWILYKAVGLPQT